MPVNDLTIYDDLAEGWWQAGSQLHMLARLNPPRFAYFDPLVACWQGLRVLDLGCGGGLATACLARRGARVVGLDLSWPSLCVARRHTQESYDPAPVFLRGWAEALPFADASFDVVWCTDVLEHLADLPAAIMHIARVLKPGGLFLYDTINRTWLSRLLAIWFWEYLAGLAPRGTHDWHRFIPPPELRHLLLQHGLQPGAIRGMLPIWLPFRHGWRFRLIRSTGVLYLGYAVKRAASGCTPLSQERRLTPLPYHRPS
jgi:2-polyprenyl-6-hydroxyphenyl methylase/3-demethylubiquinone-9 3-methyltransferase